MKNKRLLQSKLLAVTLSAAVLLGQSTVMAAELPSVEDMEATKEFKQESDLSLGKDKSDSSVENREKKENSEEEQEPEKKEFDGGQDDINLDSKDSSENDSENNSEDNSGDSAESNPEEKERDADDDDKENETSDDTSADDSAQNKDIEEEPKETEKIQLEEQTEQDLQVQAASYGWNKQGSNWYYINPQTKTKVSGWQKISGKWFYFSSAGWMQIGWQKVRGKWYYLGNDNDGAMKKGLQKIHGKWYYFSDDGAMQSGWQKISGKWYYFGNAEDGSMKTYWQKVSGRYYWLGHGNDGVMKTGWQTINKKKYYFYSDGSMASNCTIDGYYINSNGEKSDSNSTLNTWVFPCPSITYVSSEFGYRESPGGIGSTNHKGVDMAAPANSRVLAVAAGTVVASGYGFNGEGNYAEIDHGNGIHTIYMHLIASPVVKKGSTVKAGQVIGYVGMTGAATGYHLHFGVKVNGTYVNPWNYLKRPSGM